MLKKLIVNLSQILCKQHLSTNSINAVGKNKLLNQYTNLLDSNLLHRDPHQLNIVHKLNDFHNKITDYEIEPIKDNENLKSYFKNFLFARKKPNKAVKKDPPKLKGIYLVSS